MINTDYFWFRECPICDGQGRLIIKKILTLINYFSVAMSCWENEDDLTQQRKKFMEYSIKSKIVNASEDDISNFHWEKYKLHKCSDTFI